VRHSIRAFAHPSFRPQALFRPVHGDRCTLILLGATGDLAKKKLLSAVGDLRRKGLLPGACRIIGVDRMELDDAGFRGLVAEAIAKGDGAEGLDPRDLHSMLTRTHYVAGDLTDPDLYEDLVTHIGLLERDVPPESRNRLFYLAVPPAVFEPAVAHLSRVGLLTRRTAEERPWARAIVEKPFGRSFESAAALDRAVRSRIEEHQIFRIDHYLGKETVQNIVVFRAANAMFEPIWNRDHVSHVQITAAESVGVEGRGGYYDTAGAVRDMFQNHLFQLLALTGMELPTSLRANAVRDEKVKLLRSVRVLDPTRAVRAQYGSGVVGGRIVRGYREETGVSPETHTETYAALELAIDNGRWRGVPFFLRSGKRLAGRCTEIAVHFKTPPYLIEGLTGEEPGEPLPENVLVLRVQPEEGMSLSFATKVPGVVRALDPELSVAPVDMRFDYDEAFGTEHHAAYETLLLDATIGDATLFTRSDEVATSWRLLDPLLERWAGDRSPLPTYHAGTWGPKEADALLEDHGFGWRVPGS